jgi:glycine/D-amino acid oxidase-like deaminating enzyme
VRAGAVVVCVNAYSQHLVPLRVRPVRGQMLATAPVASRVFERPAYANRGYRYWRQRADGSLLVGGWRDTAADEEVGEEERTTPRIQQQLERFLREHCADAKVTHRWAGTMGFSHDALPYVGRLNSGVLVNAGFTGHGMAFATATGELVADLLRGEKRNETDLFAPERA